MPDKEKVIQALDDSLKNQRCGFIDGVGDVYAVSEEIIKNVIVLLKEQEPKQVLSVADSVGEMEVGYCPACRRGITNKTSDPTKFCKYCGQELKWNEID